MREQLNCPNCGQPITSPKCEYCGTVFLDFADISLNEPSYLRIKYNDKVVIVKAIPVTMETQFNPFNYSADYVDMLHSAICSKYRMSTSSMQNCTLDLSFIIEPDDSGKLFEQYELKEE